MDEKITIVNSQLVKVFNDILTIEETELKKSDFFDLSIKEMHTIEAIGMGGNKTTGEVAKELSITVGTLTVAINNLVKKGYVDRVRSESDRRIVRLKLTNRGRLFYRVHQHFHKKMVEAVLEDMSEEEKQALVKGLSSLHHFLKKYY
ncbi:MarR family winged helix-turn-helix transcriptional regulator [Vagococcus sp. JNUCC 83]